MPFSIMARPSRRMEHDTIARIVYLFITKYLQVILFNINCSTEQFIQED